jgi:hypothetical protein
MEERRNEIKKHIMIYVWTSRDKAATRALGTSLSLGLNPLQHVYINSQMGYCYIFKTYELVIIYY